MHAEVADDGRWAYGGQTNSAAPQRSLLTTARRLRGSSNILIDDSVRAGPPTSGREGDHRMSAAATVKVQVRDGRSTATAQRGAGGTVETDVATAKQWEQAGCHRP
jgi:hypothetical protein